MTIDKPSEWLCSPHQYFMGGTAVTLDWSKEIETMEDPPRPVRVLATNLPCACPIVVMIDGNKGPSNVSIDGRIDGNGGKPYFRNVPPPEPDPVLLEGWVNLYSDQNIKGTMQPSKRSADDVAREGRVECRRIVWMSDGSPVPGEEGGMAVPNLQSELNKMTSDRDAWRTMAEEALSLLRTANDQVEARQAVVEAAVAVSDHYNATCFGSIAALHDVVRTYQTQPKKSAAEAVSRVAAMMGPVKNCTTCGALSQNAYCKKGMWSECTHSGYGNWEPRHD